MPHLPMRGSQVAAEEARQRRIEDLFARSLTAGIALQQSGWYDPQLRIQDQDGDRAVVGTNIPLAHGLLRRGGTTDTELACHILDTILATQERHPQHPHRGNWPRFVGDGEITDLNSAPFILRWLLPLLLAYGERLPTDLLSRCRDCVRLALEEIERLAVSPTYTNIHVMSLFCLLAGGQWLDSPGLLDIGRERWERWVRFTLQSGAPREYNSTGYLELDLTMLAHVRQYVHDRVVRVQAALLYERFWLHGVLHLHRPTHQLAGPHARSYWSPMMTGQGRLKWIIWRETGWTWLLEPGPYGGAPVDQLPVSLELALTNHWLPPSARAWLEHQERSLPCEVRETASATEGHDLSTYLSPAYALGTASRTYSADTGILAIEQMANHCLLHYARPGKPGGWGMVYSRYVVNEQAWGTLGSFAFRPKTNFFDQGHFAAAQNRNKAIALYTLRPLNDTYVTSLKTVVALQSGDGLERVWVNARPVALDESLPSLAAGDWLIVEDGAVYIAVQPLEPTCLSRTAPIRLERGPLGELWLSIYNYAGVARRLWDYASLEGAYWRGNLRAGFILEVAARSEYALAADFLAHLRQTRVADNVDADFIRTVTYRSGGDEIALRYDLWNTRPRERLLNGSIYAPPQLASPLAVQGDRGRLSVGSAVLTTHPQPMWLIAQELDPAQRCWIAVNPQDQATPMRLETPCGVVTAAAWSMGRLEWHAPEEGEAEIVVETLHEPVELQVPRGVAVRYAKPTAPHPA